MTYEFDFSCCHPETMEEISAQLETYIQEVVLAGHVLSNCMYIIITFYLLVFLSQCLFVQDAASRQSPP